MKNFITVRKTFFYAILVVFGIVFLIGNITFPTTGAQNKNAVVKGNQTPVPAGTYNLDPAHSLIGFSVRHLEINWVEGRFHDFTGTINFNDQDVTKSTVEFTAKIDSIDTGVAPRDKHLKTADFFDAATYPEMKFTSTKIEKKGKDQYVLH